jgi:holo-[acyl-carrier protein] synthase
VEACQPTHRDNGAHAAPLGLRLGVDLVEISQMADSQRFGDRFLDRFFTAAEVAACRRHGQLSLRRLAACFAAKEATLKILDSGGIAWSCIEVVGHASAPTLRLWREARERAEQLGLVSFKLSLSYQSALAVALVVAQVADPDAGAEHLDG